METVDAYAIYKYIHKVYQLNVGTVSIAINYYVAHLVQAPLQFGISLQVVKGSVTPDSLAALRRKLITCYTNLVDGTQGAVATMENAEVT